MTEKDNDEIEKLVARLRRKLLEAQKRQDSEAQKPIKRPFELAEERSPGTPPPRPQDHGIWIIHKARRRLKRWLERKKA